MAALHKDEEAPHDPMEDQAHEEHMDEESSHISMVEQEPPLDSIEDQIYEEDFDEDFEDQAPQDSIEDEEHEEQVDKESTQASMPSFHEDKGLVSHDPPQI
jgi:hypothetical protein